MEIFHRREFLTKQWKTAIFVFAFSVIVGALSASTPVLAKKSADLETKKEVSARMSAKSKKGKWKQKKQKMYYRFSSGRKAKGLQKIGGKYYYFDKSGVQRTGWQKIQGDYYFFRNYNGEKGRMVKNKKVNGITLKKSGKAKLTKDSRRKLNVLIKAKKIVDKITKPAMKKSQKLKICFKYALRHFLYRGSPKFIKAKNWDYNYALDMFDRGHGSCYSYGAAFAYLANAVGYEKAYAVSSGGHGWAEVNGKIYDLSWELVDKKHNYYALNPKLSGIDGRPNYKRNRIYVKKI